MKKRNDILQMAVLEPDLCILDESDSGLDIDALKIVSDSVNALRDGKRAFIIVTHYQLSYQAGLRPLGGLLNPAISNLEELWLVYRTAATLQQWHHLFDGERQRSPQGISSRSCALGLPTRKHENWKYTPRGIH